jgi:energy-coupling factor transport system permease protein
VSALAADSLFYRRRGSPLHAATASVGAAWALALIAAALILFDPIVLCALMLAVLCAGFGARVGGQLARTLRLAVIVALPIVLINVLVSRKGLTVFARLGDLGPFGQGDLTVEAVVYGAVIALKVTLLLLITTLASLSVDPDELLRGFRRLSFRSALTLALAMRMLPLLSADAHRLADAQRTRPGKEAARRNGREWVALMSALVAGSLDRASEVAATLELRGFALAAKPVATRRRWRPIRARRRRGKPIRTRPRGLRPIRTQPPRRRLTHASRARPTMRRAWSRHDLAFACSALATVALALAGRASGVASFVAYPLLKVSSTPETLILSVVLCIAVMMPFLDRYGIQP